MRRFSKILVKFLASLLVLASATVVLLHTQPGGWLLARVVNSLLSTPEATVQVSPPALDWGGALRIDSVNMSDADGRWLQVTGINAQWHPLALLRGSLSIDRIDVATIAVERKPAQQTPAAQQTSSGFVPALPIDIAIGKVSADNISLGADIAGMPVRLAADGSLQFDAATGGLQAATQIQRDDDVAGRLDAAIGYQPDRQTLSLDLSASEPSGGLIARLLDIGELPAIDVSLKGDGPLDDWAANLAIALDGVQTVTGQAKLTETLEAGATSRVLKFSLDGALEPLAPTEVRPLFAGATKAQGTLTFDPDLAPQSLRVDAETAAFVLSAEGRQSPEIVSANLSAQLKAPVSLAFAGETVSASDLKVTATASGTPEQADWSAEITGSDLAGRQASIASLLITASGQDANLIADTLQIPVMLDLTANLDTSNRPALQATLAGVYAPSETKADGRLTLADLTALSALTGRDLSGALSTTFKLQAVPQSGTGTATFDTSAKDVALGVPRLDPLLHGASTMTGRLSRSAEGMISADDLHLIATGLELALAGQTDLAKIEATVSATLADLHLIDPALAGKAKLQADLKGPLQAPQVVARLSSDELTMQGEPVRNLSASADLTASLTRPAGNIDIGATFRDQPVTGHAGFSSDDTGTRRIEDIRLAAGQSRLTGALAFDAEDTPSGSLALSSPDLAEIGPLLLQEIAGTLQATIDLGSDDGVAVARVNVTGRDITRQSLKLGSAELAATIKDLWGVPHIDGALTATDIISGDTVVEQLTAQASGTAAGTDFTASAGLDGGNLALAGQVGQTPTGIAVTLTEAKGQYQGQETRLAAPARIVIPSDGPVTLDTATFMLGSGNATVAGTLGDTIDLKIGLEKVPAELADLVAPTLHLGGRISGRVDVSGTATDPVATWSLTWNGAETTALSGLGLPGADITSDGHFAGSTVSHKSVLSIGSDGRLTAAGSVQIAGAQGLDMTVTGALPFALVQKSLTQSGLRLDGTAAVDLRLSGTTANPIVNGQITTRNATAVSLNTGLVIKNIAATASVDRTQIKLTSLTGTIGAGGTVTASGTIGLSETLPAQISLKIKEGAYTDGQIVTAKLDADLTLTGPLAVSPKIGGTILIKRADITIPQALATTLAPVDVKHVNAPQDVARQAARLNAGPKDKSSGGIGLDLTISAPGQIFVRGRGLQVELGGQIAIGGTSADPVTTGAFTLKNGTLSILSRLLTLTKGQISFLGNFDPLLDFAATATVNSTAITVGLTGNASNPEVTFSSSPSYPQEEILALLLFDRNLSSLSATQIAQLASAVATLGGADPLEKLRKSLGIDAINITTDEDNNTSAELRKRVSDKVYLGVQQGTQEGSSRVTVDIDVTKNLRARGETDASGSSKAGIFFEKEY